VTIISGAPDNWPTGTLLWMSEHFPALMQTKDLLKIGKWRRNIEIESGNVALERKKKKKKKNS
jgi:hypothetical protein